MSMSEQVHQQGHRDVRWFLGACLVTCSIGIVWGSTVLARSPLSPSRKSLSPPVSLEGTAPTATGRRASRITQVQIDSVESPTFEGHSFGSGGQYERLLGHYTGELDPTDPLNAFIVNIDFAPRNAQGMVEYSADFRILKPIDMKTGNGIMFYDVANRGNQRAFNLHEDFKGAYGSYPPKLQNLGDGFLLEQGYTLVWSGWQGDAPTGEGRVTARLPIAKMPDGSSYRRWISTELLFSRPTRSGQIDYPAVEDSMPKAKLYRRANPHAPLELVPRESWSFAKCNGSGASIPSKKDVCVPTEFSPNFVYNLVYEAQDPYVMGIGFAAVRDFVSFLRYDTTNMNPIVARRGGSAGKGNPIQSVIMFGQSQSGRFVRDWIYQSGNHDNAGRKVVDGAISHTAGSRKTYTNYIFAEPGRFSRQAEDHYFAGDQFPFTYETITDPLTGRIDGLLARCRAAGTCPKIMQWDSGSEPWIARDSLVLTDPLGMRDLPLPENVRFYYFSSTQHEGGDGHDPLPDSRAICEQLPNPNSYRETERALLGAMRTWVTKQTLPPASQYPKLSDGTLVPSTPQAVQGFPVIPGVHYTGKFNDLFVNDDFTLPPRHTTAEYTVLVPKVDSDGNDIAGVRSAMLQVPIATYTGWNVRRAGFMGGEVCGTAGSFIPFAKTKADRGSDPRLSLEERYRTRTHYVELVRAATERLQHAGFLLPKDAERLIHQAEQRNLGLPK
jgi:hypothetical protein